MKLKPIAIALAVLIIIALAAHVLIIASVALVLVAAVAAFAWWAFWPHRKLPRHRSRHLRLRVHLRLHPGPGHARPTELHLHWGRFAAFRESGRTRPSLTRWHRLTHPKSHSLLIGHTHWFHRLRVSIQENGFVLGPPRFFKSALLSWLILEAPGAVVSTSTKPDQYRLTAKARARRGPVYVFNPQAIGGIPSTIQWDPLEGCIVPATAIRRADAFSGAASVGGTEDASFWQGKASDSMRSIFSAASLDGADMTKVGDWAGGEVKQAVAILYHAGRTREAEQLAKLDGEAQKTAETIRMVLGRALGFLNDPALAQAVMPARGRGFDIDRFLLERGTLYLIAKGNGQDSTVGPLFAALADEIVHRATQLGSQMEGGRLDPPLHLNLDEVTSICPVPLPDWSADAGGQGINIWSAFHGFAQLRRRWGEHGAQAVIDTTNVAIFMPGIKDAQTLSQVSDLCGTAAFDGKHEPVLTADMIRTLPKSFALAVRNNLHPVVFKVAAGWRHPEYRKLRRRPMAEQRSGAVVIAAAARPEPVQIELPVSEPVLTASSNGHRHVEGDEMLLLRDGHQ